MSRLERDLDAQLLTQGYRRQELAALALPDRIFAGGRRGSYDPYLSGYRGAGGYTGLVLGSECVLPFDISICVMAHYSAVSDTAVATLAWTDSAWRTFEQVMTSEISCLPLA